MPPGELSDSEGAADDCKLGGKPHLGTSATTDRHTSTIGLVWRHRWILLVSLVFSVAGTLPFALSGKATYQSSGTVLIPSGDPVAVTNTQTSAVDTRLNAFSHGQTLLEAVRSRMGAAANGLISVTTGQQRAGDLYSLTATAKSSQVARDAVSAGALALIDESNSLTAAQVAQLRTQVNDQMLPLEQQRGALVKRVLNQKAAIHQTQVQLKQVENDIPKSSGAARGALQEQANELSTTLRDEQVELDRLNARVAFIESNQGQLTDLVQGAVQIQLTRKAASTLLSAPSAPSTDSSRRVVQTIGLAVLAGLVMATLVVIWLERRRLVPASDHTTQGREPPGAPSPPARPQAKPTERSGERG